MIERIVDLPSNVLGFKAIGKVTAEDYESVLVPALEEKLRTMRQVRLLYCLGQEFEGYTGAAAWEDAKVGLKHLSRFDRIAVVTDVDWIGISVKVFGFAIPGEVRVFDNAHLQQAREWVSELPEASNLTFKYLDEQGVLILRPKGELDAADFERVSDALMSRIQKQGGLYGVMIVAEHFPGWDDLSAFAAHFRFVNEHRKAVRRLAVVTNDRLLSAMPHLANHFVVSEARHFSADKEDEALAWVSQA